MAKYNREELLWVLNDCRPALVGNPALPELGHLWFSGKSVCAYDGELGVRRTLATDINCGVPGRTLIDLLGTTTLKEVSLEQPDDTTVVLQMGRSKHKLSTLPYKRRVWPFPAKLPEEKGLKLSPPVLDAFQKLTFVKTNKGSMAVHHGLTLAVLHETVGVYATDGSCIAYKQVKQRNVSMPLFVIPWGMAAAMTAQFAELKNAQLWHISPAGNAPGHRCLVAGTAGRTICGTLLDLTGNPNLAQLMAKHDSKMYGLPKGFSMMLERASIMSGKEEALVTLTMSKGEMRAQGKWTLGTLDAVLQMGGGPKTAVSCKLQADRIVSALRHADEFGLSERALTLAGPAFGYVLGSK